MSDFIEHTLTVQAYGSLFNSEIENYIKQAAIKNNLVLNGSFGRSDYVFYFDAYPTNHLIKYTIKFMARPKTADEILAEQIEFQIKQLES
ncbi:hypothetical protein [Flavobacterium geliluteum]|uniref:Uncharacterized protein n=1 Tax=Flavobacterium geliluteum TaxID=2816120 RepID=A0A940XA41_9FLAO|nr:hypothetical protein [Flavobacterium geliluteum]MBP4139650.1 hypothetical protein [Flavobacterium geliluteum]